MGTEERVIDPAADVSIERSPERALPVEFPTGSVELEPVADLAADWFAGHLS